MQASQKRTRGLALALALGAVFIGYTERGVAQGMSAAEAFADGNRLFRDDLYWAALLRYSQAEDAGMSSPILHYNTGVAHYKARQFKRAKAHLQRAMTSPELELLAQYNLGLTAYAAGDEREALTWFRRTRDQERSKKISRLSVQAIARIRDDVLREREAEQPAETVASKPQRSLEREPREFAEFEFHASAGFGNDDNVFRTPGESYLDISNPNQPVQVDPVVQSGSFVPFRFGAKYTVNSFEHESFFGRYRGNGRLYSDEAQTNADEYIHELAVGTEYAKDRENRQSRVFSAFTVAHHEETYFDPDDGLVRTIDTVNQGPVEIGDRLSYLRYGPQISTRQSWNRLSYSLWAKAQLWNYEDAEVVPEYDHEFFRLGGNIQYRFWQSSLVRLTVDAYRRYFSDRPSFELDGRQLLGNPGVEYRYYDAGLLLRQRLTRGFWFGLSYMRTEREDAYIGYNDYGRDTYGAELSLHISDRFELRADARHRIYDYTNAFAFNNPAAGNKTLETTEGNLTATLDVGWNLQLVGEYSYRDVASNDTRIAYERSLYLLSLQWAYE